MVEASTPSDQLKTPTLQWECLIGGDGLNLFESRPLEDILADIAEGWNTTKRSLLTRDTTEVYNSAYEL